MSTAVRDSPCVLQIKVARILIMQSACGLTVCALGVASTALATVTHHIMSCTVLPTPRSNRPIGLLWKPLPRVKKSLGGLTKIGLLWRPTARGTLLSIHLLISCQFREIYCHLYCWRAVLIQLSGIKTSHWAININYRKSVFLLFSRPIGRFGSFYCSKAPKLVELGVFFIHKNWATSKSFTAGWLK